ncbi:MAG TPA: glycosyltransferase family 4 protein [Azospirillaceae bacterium]|nr:glycosyltransferase family 4 protein [Azospirillaceae bacterium]
MTADSLGGVWDYALELAAGLTPHGITVDLAVMGPPPGPHQRVAAATVPGLVLHEGTFRLEWMPDCEGDLAHAADWLLELEQRVRPDVVHANGYAEAALPFAAPVLLVAHSDVATWWRAVHGSDPPAEWTAYRHRVAAGLAAAAQVVAPTRAYLDAVSAAYGAPARSNVIHNGRSARLWRPLDKEPFVLAVGRLWDEGKNTAALSRVAGSLDWPVVVAGPWQGPDGRGRPPEGLRCLGRLAPAELAQWFGRAAVFAHPARYEPFGLSVLEAALSGCALVLGDIPTLRELWQGAALFVPPDDSDALRETLAGLGEDPEAVSALSKAARHRAANYPAALSAAAYAHAYGRLHAGADASAARHVATAGILPEVQPGT